MRRTPLPRSWRNSRSKTTTPQVAQVYPLQPTDFVLLRSVAAGSRAHARPTPAGPSASRPSLSPLTNYAGIPTRPTAASTCAATGQATTFPVASASCGDGLPNATSHNPSPCDLLAVDPNLRNPYSINYSLGVTHTFGTNLSRDRLCWEPRLQTLEFYRHQPSSAGRAGYRRNSP